MANENKATGERPQAKGSSKRMAEEQIEAIQDDIKKYLDEEPHKPMWFQLSRQIALIAAWRAEKNAYENLVEAISETTVSKCIGLESSQYVCIGEDEWENIRMLAGVE